jgi:hypothetical protein
MHRRDFLGTSAAAAMGTILSEGPSPVIGGSPSQTGGPAAAGLVKTYTDRDHRRRLENIRFAHQNIRAAMRKHLVTSYLPGQCCYNLGEYPCLKPWDPDDWDEQELDKLRAEGIELIQVHEEWNDPLRLFGGNKLAPLNPAGLRRFVEMAHRRGMKLIVYVSSGFFQRSDPDFRAEWARPQDLIELYYDYALCSVASPSWRAYFLPRLRRILDEYGIDGIYNDLGYAQLAGNGLPPTKDEVLAFEESATHDGALADLLALIYSEIHRRGGIVKVHRGGVTAPLTDLKVYDYLWVGEAVDNGDRLRQAVKNHTPYVVPCLDMSRAKIENEDQLYLHAIPYVQFPLLLAGRPFTGQRASIPGLKYQPEDKDFWTRHCRAIWRHYQAHPEGPHSYGWWDSTPGRPQARPTHARWLKLYRPMVEEGTWAWLEVSDSKLFSQSLPRDVVASVFANRHLYLVLANYGHSPAIVKSNAQYVALAPQPGGPATHWQIPARSLVILQRAVG